MYSSCFEISVTQHDILRDLALHLSNRGSIHQHRRLVMATRKENGLLPKEWSRYEDQPFEAQIVSINTGNIYTHQCLSKVFYLLSFFSLLLCDLSLMNFTLQVK